jgi:hypothetical protein
MWSYGRKILEKSIREKLPVINLQVHLSQTYMQVLDWMHLALQIFFRTCLGRKEIRDSFTRCKK